jgi:hypothetical protein
MKNIILITLISTLIFSCTKNKEKINKAKFTVNNFFNIVKSEDESKMKEAYDSLSKFQTYYKTDSGTIKDVIITTDSTAIVKTVNNFTNGFGKKFTRDITFYLKSDTSGNYKIMDTKGFGFFDEDLLKFGKTTGCINKNDSTDIQISKKIGKSDTLCNLFISQIKGILNEQCKVTKWSWETGWGGSASGKGFVYNGSKYSIPNLKYIITYLYNGREITQDQGYISYDVIYSDQMKDFTFYTSYVGGARNARIELVFDNEKIKNYILKQKNFDGTEANDLDSLKKWNCLALNMVLDMPTFGWDLVSNTERIMKELKSKMRKSPDIRIGVSSSKAIEKNYTFGMKFNQESLEEHRKSLPIFEKFVSKL